ncbi:MAG: DNA alkylation repair protein [Gemmatimonadaceae bacterium]
MRGSFRFAVAFMNAKANTLRGTPAPCPAEGGLSSPGRAPLHKLVRSRALWERRIAIISTFAFIRNGDLDNSLTLANSCWPTRTT